MYYIGLRTNAAPISSRTDDNNDVSNNFKGYCHAFIETLKTKFNKNIETLPVSRDKHLTGLADDEKQLDALCGPYTITTGRESGELQKNGLDGKFSNSFAWTSIAVVLKNKDKDIFLHPTSVQGLKIGVLNGTTTKEAVRALYPSLVKKIKYYDNFEEAIKKLEIGDITAYFDDEILLKTKLKTNLFQNSNKESEYTILHMPSVIEYGIVVFRIKQNKNYKLLQEINKLLENVQQQPVGSIRIKILEDNKNFQDFINSVEPKEDSSRKPNHSPPVSSSQNLN
ncbi:transporter substrate-binding domain-containing protein [Brasilonema sp. CT11]|nr:transporter substrate-binding domain-containing protein [Brasilonema sp. CT11]